MNQKKQKPTKSASAKPPNTTKKGKDDSSVKSSGDASKRKKNIDEDYSPENDLENSNSRTIRKSKAKADEKNSQSQVDEELPPLKKLIDYDEFQEITEFLNFINKENSQKTPKSKPKVQVESEFDKFVKTSQRLSQLAFGLFDKIGLSADPIRPKVGATVTSTSNIKPKPEEKPEEDSGVMEVEEKKEEIKEITEEKKPKPRLVDLLKIDLYPDYDGKDDDRLANINFEPTLEMMRTSNHIDVETVCNLIEQSKKKDGDEIEIEGKDNVPSRAIPENLNENMQKIHELVAGISESDFQRLEPEVYLNDTLINFYLKFIELGLINKERMNKVHIFNTYFMAKMRKLFSDVASDFSKFDKVYEKLERWTKKINLFEKDFVLLPVNENEHWNIVVFCYPWRLYSKDDDLPFVVYLDSICRMEDIYAKMLYNFFVREAKAKKPAELSTAQEKLFQISSAGFPFYQPMVPKQSNWTDCGLYLLQYVELFSESEAYILENKDTDINKTKWFPRKLISDKRDDMKRLIRDLKAHKYEAINEYLDRRTKRMKDYSKSKDQYDLFDQKGFEKAVAYKFDGSELTDEEIKILKLDYYYFGSLDYDQADDMHR